MDFSYDIKPHEYISGELKREIHFLAKLDRKGDMGWDDVTDEIVNRFYPSLTKLEKLFCRCIIQTGWDTDCNYCLCEEIEIRLLIQYKQIFRNKDQIKNIVIPLCAKGIINWMTQLIPVKNEVGETLHIYKRTSYHLMPEIIHDICLAAFGEILNCRRC